jgi:mRNA interferase RelE/StbE
MISREVNYSNQAAKTLKRIDAATRRIILAKVEQLAVNPAALANNIDTIKGSNGAKRLRVGDWRVIYTETLVVLEIIKINSRGSVYD